ncbi:MAG: MerR family transcriptional regulator [Elusimicrobia bacterium]|nr:MerR family transcriptional regulator [Elusimicrobiota bacterium]
MELEDKNYFSIGEVEKVTGVKSYILRYWEQEFRILRPARGTSGQRKYIRTDVDLILKIKDLLYIKGFTIAGTKKYLIEEKRKRKKELELDFGKETISVDLLRKAKKELEIIYNLLK